MIYEKNLTEDLRLRLSASDMDFLRGLSEERSQSISECIRSLIGEYRRSLQVVKVFQKALTLAENDTLKGTELSNNGDTKTDINNQLQL